MPFNNARRPFVERRAGVTNALDLPADPLAAFPAHRTEIRIGYARAAVAVLGVAVAGCAGDGAVDAPASPAPLPARPHC